jgi:hypothetical protein
VSEIPTLLLDPANPYDFDAGELEQLARDIEAKAPGLFVVPIRRPEEGYGGPLMEVLHVWEEACAVIDAAGTTAAAFTFIVKTLRARWQQDRDQHPPPERPRPRVFNLYNENDELIRRVTIDLPAGEPVEENVEAISPVERPPHPRPMTDWRSDGSS